MKITDIFRDECGGELRKLRLGPGLEHSSGSRFGNREGCISTYDPPKRFRNCLGSYGPDLKNNNMKLVKKGSSRGGGRKLSFLFTDLNMAYKFKQ